MRSSVGSIGSLGSRSRSTTYASPTAGGPVDVLVVGHRRLLAEALCTVLGREGYRATVSESGPVAAPLSEEVRALQPTVVVIEVSDVRTSRELEDLVPRLRRSGTHVMMLLPHSLREAEARAMRRTSSRPGSGPLSSPLEQFLATVSRVVRSSAGRHGTDGLRRSPGGL